MKINNILKIALCITLIVFLEAANLKKKGDVPTILDQTQMLILNELVKGSLKMGTSTGEDTPFGTCFKVMSSQSHMDGLVKFWSLLLSVFKYDSIKPSLTQVDMKKFSEVGAKDKMTNGKNCEEIINEMVADDDTLAGRARNMRNTISPELPTRPAVPANKKNWITAFSGVHRYTKESTTLIPKLNDPEQFRAKA
jgi:hypothetical protein